MLQYTILKQYINGSNMGIIQRCITDEVYKSCCEQLNNINKFSRAAIRLRAIASAKEHGIAIVAKVFNITCNTLRTWVKNYKQDVTNLEYKPGRGRKSKLQDCHKQSILEWVSEDCAITLARIVTKLFDEHGLKTSKSAVHRMMSELSLSYITPRPLHYKQDKETMEEFKKNLKTHMASNKDKAFYFFDESRFGTNSNLGFGWFKTGSRTESKSKAWISKFLSL